MTSADPQAATTPDRQVTLTLDEALQLAVERHRAGLLDDAEMIYAEVLRRSPDRAEVLNYMGILQHQRDDNVRALELLRHAIDVSPEASGIWNNLGNVLLHLDRADEAEQAFRRSVALVENPEALANLGRVLRRRRDWVESERACRRALAIDARCGVAWHNLSMVLLGQERLAEAVEAALKAEDLIPALPRRRSSFARALLVAGEVDKAAAIYRDWLAEQPDNPYVQHQLAACTGEGTPERASDAYVEHVFDGFAATFDTRLASLGYCGPRLVADAAGAILPEAAHQFDIADIGCGTGQCGLLMHGWARRLWGCDLSGAMLDHARRRGVYDEFRKMELRQFLEAHPGSFDVVVSADTLIYFGDLHAVIRAAHGALRVGGHLVFTVEALPDDDAAGHRLLMHGRYAHTLAYLRAVLDTAGLTERAVGGHVIRMECCAPVQGWVVTASRDR